MVKKQYKVWVDFSYQGRWFIYAKNADDALECVEGKQQRVKCWKYPSLACTTLPKNKSKCELVVVGWGFSMTHGFKTITCEVVLSNHVLPVMKTEKHNCKKKCYEVPVIYKRVGYFDVIAENEECARNIVEKYCCQRKPIYKSSLPSDEVAWEFCRKDIQKNIGKIIERRTEHMPIPAFLVNSFQERIIDLCIDKYDQDESITAGDKRDVPKIMETAEKDVLYAQVCSGKSFYGEILASDVRFIKPEDVGKKLYLCGDRHDVSVMNTPKQGAIQLPEGWETKVDF